MSESLREPLDVRRRAGALWLTLNRPAARNGIDAGLVAAIGAALDAAESDPDLAAVVITAAGRVFCAGADLKLIAGLSAMPPLQAAAGLLDFLTAAGELFDRIEAFGKPVIAAVDGLAVAGDLARTDLVTVLVGADTDLRSVVDACVDDIAAKSPRGIQVMKQLVHSGRDQPPPAARREELGALERHALSADFAEGLRAFGDKRRPVFTGR